MTAYEEDLAAAANWVRNLPSGATVYRSPAGLPWTVSMRVAGDDRGYGAFLGVIRRGNQRRQYKSLHREDLIKAHKATTGRKVSA